MEVHGALDVHAKLDCYLVASAIFRIASLS